MQEKDQIAELFKETFSNYEAPVRPELWQNIASRIQSPASPALPDGSAAVKITAAASKISGTSIAWIGSAVIILSAATGYYFYTNIESTPATKSDIENIQIGTSATPVVEAEININEEATINSTDSKPDANSRSSSNQVNSPNTFENQQLKAESSTESFAPVSETPAATTTQKEEFAKTESDKNTLKSNPVSSANPSLLPSENAIIKNKIQALPLSGKSPLLVNFSAPFGGENSEWVFGDGQSTEKGTHVSHVYNEPGTYLVTVKSTDETGKTITELVKIEVLSDLSITNIPNIFTPNGDGVNDVFKVNAGKDVAVEVSIFDKSGRFVHKYSGSENSWNGKINNVSDAGEGTYFYVIFATGKNGDKNTQKGTITLKR